ncbi:hypothetical protein KFE94_02435 [bacterium SCSIO 12643]|nr:hypothetical protein KFE94_02435 [bacterium SCSIO 12643]
MSIEIRELLIKVKIEDPEQVASGDLNMNQIRQFISRECKKEIKKQLNRKKER